MVSIIVPIYNVKDYLNEAIESVICQSYKDLEIILVDDGSTDGSGSLCDTYKEEDSRIKVIHQSNKGLSGARNAGLDICSGEYIAFLDSDDAFCKDFIKVMLEAMQKNNADIVECNYAIFKNKRRMNERRIALKPKAFGMCLKREGVYTTREAFELHFNGKIAVNAWNKFYHHSIWSNLRFREGQNFEDVDIILPVLGNAKRVCLIDENLILHRKRRGSITKTNSLKSIKDGETARLHYWNYIIENTPLVFDENEKNCYVQKFVGYLISQYFYYARLNIPEKNECMAYLEERICDIYKKIEINKCKMKVRIAYYLFFNVPLWIASIIYCFFRFIRLTIKKMYK